MIYSKCKDKILYYNILNPPNAVEDDKCDVMEELENVLSRYYEIGVRLHLPDDKLKAIKKISSDAEAMNEVIVEWLKKNYNSNRFGSPTWKALVDAVGSPSGGNNKAEAEKIASKHRTGESCTVYRIAGIF